MGGLSKEEQARFSGALWAIKLVEEKGLVDATRELERRGIRNMPLKLNKADVDVFVKTERDNITKCLLIDTLVTLHDEFGFEKDQCERFIQRWNLKVSCLAEGYVNWKELRQEVYDDLGIWIPLSKELEEEC